MEFDCGLCNLPQPPAPSFCFLGYSLKHAITYVALSELTSTLRQWHLLFLLAIVRALWPNKEIRFACACVCACLWVCPTLARERTMGLSMMPLRKIRSMSLAPVPDGSSLRLSSTCCMAKGREKKTVSERGESQPLLIRERTTDGHKESASDSEK